MWGGETPGYAIGIYTSLICWLSPTFLKGDRGDYASRPIRRAASSSSSSLLAKQKRTRLFQSASPWLSFWAKRRIWQLWYANIARTPKHSWMIAYINDTFQWGIPSSLFIYWYKWLGLILTQSSVFILTLLIMDVPRIECERKFTDCKFNWQFAN